MIELLDIGFKDAVAYRLKDRITRDEMKMILSLFQEKVDLGKPLLIYQEVESIGGAEIDAIVEKFKFFKENGWSHFERIAVVTGKGWVHRLVDLEGKLFKGFNMRGFSMDDKQKAVAFLKNG